MKCKKTLDIEPYNLLSDYKQIKGKIKDIYLLAEDEEIKRITNLWFYM